ncbi:MAG: AI-2E family transporter [Firmicutes bacterium]|nr:AI-2E family transporter [Bacillota bacterium]
MENKSIKKKKRFSIGKEHIAWGVTAFIVICMSIVFYLVLTQMSQVGSFMGKLSNVLMPIILGIVIAYLLLPVYNYTERLIEIWLSKIRLLKKPRAVAKIISTFISLLLFVIVVLGLVLLAGPQVMQSLWGIVESLPRNLDKFSTWVFQLLKDYPDMAKYAISYIDRFEESLLKMLEGYVQPVISGLIDGITVGVINAVSFLFDLIVGFIVCVYMLNGKENFSAQAKKLAYALFKPENANQIISDTKKIHRIFSGFISGKLLDSLIIGLITFIVLSLMNMPYTVMVSVIVGVTNIIPFFGPFIGAIPSAIIIFTIDPLKSLYFIIYIIIIQQIDGNILGPKILGDSTGLPSFWVLFSILVGGGLFGFVGMVLGVPVFATIYMFVCRGIDNALYKKNMPSGTEVYSDINAFDPDSKKFVFKTPPDTKENNE